MAIPGCIPNAASRPKFLENRTTCCTMHPGSVRGHYEARID